MTPTDHPHALRPGAVAPSTPPAVDLLAEPTFEECIEEWDRYNEEKKAGRFNGWNVPEGQHIAYFAGKVHDHDADPLVLRERVAAALGVHPARLVIDYPWMW